MNNFYIKTNRVFNSVRKYSWTFVPLAAFGGLWFPKLGLLIIPLMLTLMVMAIFKGKYWCGNYCPHGSLFDFIIMRRGANRKIPAFMKHKLLMAAVFTWFMYMMISRLIKVFAIYGSASFLDRLGYIFVFNYLVVTIVGTILAFTVSPRAWCNFCPMSTMQLLTYKLGKILRLNKKTDAKVTIAAKEMCHSCGKCSRVCPLQLTPYLEFSEKNQFDNEACIRCSTCVHNCPAGILSLDTESGARKIKEETDTSGYRERRKITARIKEIKKLTGDVNEYTFKLINPAKLDYRPGQFILVKILEQPKMFRAYSIASCKKDGTEIKVSVKNIPGGLGSHILFHTFKEGDVVELEGPMGKELVVDKNAEHFLFVAGGIGITPFVPMTGDLIQNADTAKNLKLVYGVNRPQEIIYDEHFSKLQAQNEKFEYIKVAAIEQDWPGRKGLVTDVLKEMNLKGYKVYMCGPKPMINASLPVLHDAGVEPENIYYESA